MAARTHVAPAGKPLRENATAELKSFVGAILMVKFAEPPGVNVALVGEELTEQKGIGSR